MPLVEKLLNLTKRSRAFSRLTRPDTLSRGLHCDRSDCVCVCVCGVCVRVVYVCGWMGVTYCRHLLLQLSRQSRELCIIESTYGLRYFPLHTHTHTHTHPRMHTHTRTHTRTNAHTHARTHTHTHSCYIVTEVQEGV